MSTHQLKGDHGSNGGIAAGVTKNVIDRTLDIQCKQTMGVDLYYIFERKSHLGKRIYLENQGLLTSRTR